MGVQGKLDEEADCVIFLIMLIKMIMVNSYLQHSELY